MLIAYSGRSAPSTQAIADEDKDIRLIRSSERPSLVNWGRAWANSELNPDISNTTNKRVMRELFRDNGVPMPELWDVGDSSWQYPIVGRPDRHTKGRGFWLIRNDRDLNRALRGTRRKKAATHFMEYIDAPHEYRVHIFKGKSIRISEKLMGSTGSTAHGNYTTIKPTVPVKQARKAAKQAVAALGLDFGCVDVLVEDDGKPYVLEVNAAPALGGSLPRLYAEVFKEYAYVTSR